MNSHIPVNYINDDMVNMRLINKLAIMNYINTRVFNTGTMVAFAICVLFSTLSGCSQDHNEESRIRPFADNSYFWQYKGKPILLLGGSDQDNLFNHPNSLEPHGLESHLDLLESSGGNYVRNTMSDRNEEGVYAFAREGEFFDLNRWNDEYWRRFDELLRLTMERDIIVQIEFWNGADYMRDNWARHPFNPLNNINYDVSEAGLLTDVPFPPTEEPSDHTFYHTVPELDNNTVVLQYQEAFINRILEYSLPYPNVLYCINNESGEPPEWSLYWARLIHQRAKEHGVEAQVTDMRRREDITHATHRIVYDNTEDYTFAEVSQNTGNEIDDRKIQYSRLLFVRDYLGDDARPINNVKIYNDHFGGASKFLRNIFAGLAASRFHRPVRWSGVYQTRGLGLSEEAQQIIQSVRAFTNALNWFTCRPRPDLLDHDNGVYLMAEPGRQYAVGFDGGGLVQLDAGELNRPALLRWMNMHEGQWIDGGQVEPGQISLQTPDDGLWMALILADM